MRRVLFILLVALLATCPLFAGGQGEAGGENGTGEQIVVTTMNGPSENDKLEQRRHQMLLDGFKERRPDVTIEARDTYFDRQQFAAKLAARTMEDAFLVDFTQPDYLIRNDYVADITPYITEWEGYENLSEDLLRIVSDDQGNVYGIPVGGYALGLIYNRELFKRAGLDPDDPPETWEELREYAMKISDLGSGIAGFAFLSTAGQGGWHFVTTIYSYGGSLIKREGGKWVADFVNDATLDAADMLMQMRWEDDSLTQRQLLEAADTVSLMASGTLGMAIMAGDELRRIKAQYGGDMTVFGMGGLPQGGGNATLAGGAAWMFNPNTPAEVLRAAVEWSLFQTFSNYEADIRSQAERGQLVGWPQLPVFVGEYRERRQEIVNTYANAPVENYEPFWEDMKRISLLGEPPAETQKLYRDLDNVCQAILTDPFTEPEKILRQTERQFQRQVLDPMNQENQ